MKKRILYLSFLFISNLIFSQNNLSSETAILKMYEEKTRIFLEENNYKNFLVDLLERVVLNSSDQAEFKKYISNRLTDDMNSFVNKVGKGLIVKNNFDEYYRKLEIEYVNEYARFLDIKNGVYKNSTNRTAGQPCQNLDFSALNFNGWFGSYGTSNCNPLQIAGYNQGANNAVTGEHTIMTGGTDPTLPFIPCVRPGSSSSVRLGNDGTGAHAARISQTFKVNPVNPFVVYDYAIVLEDAGNTHTAAEQPYLKIRMKDANGQLISCATVDVNGSSVGAGLRDTTFTVPDTSFLCTVFGICFPIQVGPYRFKDWTRVIIPLAGYENQDVTLEFTTADCTQGGHFGYAYISGLCDYEPAIVQSAPVLCPNTTMTLTGPSGLSGYSWTGPGIVSGGNTPIVTINQPGIYNLSLTTVTSLPNVPCTFVLSDTVEAVNTAADFVSDTACVGDISHFTDMSPTGAISWSWDFDNNSTADASNQNPTFTFGSSGTFPVTLTVNYGACSATITNNVTVSPALPPAILSNVSPVCQNANPLLLTTNVSGGVWSGTGITNTSTGLFDPSVAASPGPNVITYTIGTGACAGTSSINITVTPAGTSDWTTTTLCSSSAVVDLNTFVIGTAGGVWSGQGVSGSNFNPSGLSGTIPVTYTVGAAPCQSVTTQNIIVGAAPTATWTVPIVCETEPIFFLDSLLTGTPGGTWSGNEVFGSSFNPDSLGVGNYTVTYTVGGGACSASETHVINVITIPSAAWTPSTICTSSATIDLSTLVTGTAGGSWSGTGVSGNIFDPTGLTGNIALTYSVGSGTCSATSTQNMVINSIPSTAITSVGTQCSNGTPITLNAATAGGTWSGPGVNPTTGSFNPATAGAGTHTINYTITTPCPSSSSTQITVIQSANPAWTSINLCSEDSTINLNTLVTGTSGGTWSGPGVSGNTFDPSGLSGNISVTYTVGSAPCVTSSTQTVVVTESPVATFTATPSSGYNPLTVDFTNTSSPIAANYTWTFDGGFSSSNSYDPPSLVYNTPGSYPVNLYVSNGACVDSMSLIITVYELSVLVVPNVFTPNGDGSNDYFKPVLAEGLSKFNMLIYDRWGLKMSEVTNESIGWDGNAKNGSAAPDGTYYYIVTADGTDGKEYKFTGYVSLIRAK